MADNIVINGPVVGRDNITSGQSADVDAIIAAKLKAKREEIEREAAEDAANAAQGQPTGRSGGVNFFGNGKITIGGRVVDKDLFETK